MKKHSILILLFFFLSACSQVKTYWSVVQGNYSYHRGNYQNSLRHYLSAQAEGFLLDWIEYDLATVYHSLGEVQKAEEFYAKTGDSSSELVRYHTHFNRGVLFFEQGFYSEAHNEFRQALSLYPQNTHAKVNLELAWRKKRALTQLPPSRNEDKNESLSEEEIERLFEQIKQKEIQQLLPVLPQYSDPLPGDW